MTIRRAWQIVRDPIEANYSPDAHRLANAVIQRVALVVIGGCVLLMGATFAVAVLAR